MKIGVLNDFLPGDRAGGANRAIELFMAAKPDGLDFSFCVPGGLDKECDKYLLFLTKRFSMEEMGWVQSKPYVWCGFDWWPDQDGNSKWRNLIVEKAETSVFVSPLHMERFSRLYVAEPHNPIVIPPPLDLGRLRDTETPSERNGRAIWASEWHPYKGPDLAAVLARKLEVHVDMFSPSMPANIARQRDAFTPFAHPVGFQVESDWYKTMAQYSMLIHTPRVPDAFGYVTLEAYALGLEVVLQGQTGVESFGCGFDSLLEACSKSASQLWELV